jgi:hypothetical protein
MAFTQQCEYDGSKMIEDMKNVLVPEKGKGDMKIPLDQLDPFFTDLIVKNNLGTEILKAWVHYIMPGADQAFGHTHPNDTAVFYLEIPENSGDLVFPESGERVVPKANLFAVVPKNTNHLIEKNESICPRITLAFAFR